MASSEKMAGRRATLSKCLTIFPKTSLWDSLGKIAGHLPPVRIQALFV